MLINDRRNIEFFMVENEVVDNDKITGNELLAYIVLCRYADNKTGVCYPSYNKIAENMGVSKPTAVKYINKLVDKKIISKTKKKSDNNEFYNNIYTIVGLGGSKTALPPSKRDLPPSKGGLLNKDSYKKTHIKSNNIDVADEINKYKDVFEYYLTFDNLISHKKYRTSYRKAMQKAERDLSLSAEEMKTIIKRHSQVVELTKNSKNNVKARTISELFGQKKYNSTILICEDYLDTGSYYKKFIQNHKRIKDGSSKDKPKVREVI